MNDRQDTGLAGTVTAPAWPDPDVVELVMSNMDLTARLGAALKVIDALERESAMATRLVDQQEEIIEGQLQLIEKLKACTSEAKMQTWEREIAARTRELIH